MVGCDFLQRDFFSHAFFLRLLAAPCEWATLDRFRDQAEDSKDCAFGALQDARIARLRISLADILSPGFGDANVATQPKQSNRRDRCRQSKDKPHSPGMSRPVFWTKRR